MGIVCPASGCRYENDFQVETCARCGLPLRGYVLLSSYPAQIFNAGLIAARAGALRRARDLFAAVVYWCPMDMEARSALAMACYALGDYAEAYCHWEIVLSRFSRDPYAERGLALARKKAKFSATRAPALGKQKHKKK